MDRRHFLKLSALTIGAFALGFQAQQELNVPFYWQRIQPVQLDADKLDLVQRLLANAIESHDQLIEEAIFSGY